jgi:hypothetical protein
MMPRVTHLIVDRPFPDEDQKGEEVPTSSIVCAHDDVGDEERRRSIAVPMEPPWLAAASSLSNIRPSS